MSRPRFFPIPRRTAGTAPEDSQAIRRPRIVPCVYGLFIARQRGALSIAFWKVGVTGSIFLFMCATQSPRVLHALITLRDKAKANIIALVAILISFLSLCVAIVSCNTSKSSLNIATSSLNIAKRSDVPNVRITGPPRLKATPDPNAYTLEISFENFGTEDGTGLIKIGTINSTTKEVAQLDSPAKFTRLSPDKSHSTPAKFKISKADLHNFFMICISYNDEHTDIPRTDPYFYSVPDQSSVLNGNDAMSGTVPTGERETLLADFPCAKLAK
jgi:hypothetical protein